MRTLNFTYDVYTFEGKEKVYGETCMDITMQNYIAEKFLNDTADRGDMVLVKSIDRIGREWGMTQRYIDLLMEHKVQLLCVRDRLLFSGKGATHF